MTAGKHNTRGPAERLNSVKFIWEMYEQGVPGDGDCKAVEVFCIKRIG
jgi:hypothetical protein